jgi:hypothetical protein
MYTRRLAGSAAAALALLASACADQPTAPAARAPGTAAFTASSGLTLIPNAVRYRDTGGKPATGRAGSAAVEAFALLGADGYTDVELRAHAAASAADSGAIARTQAKVYGDGGALRITRNADAGQGLRFGGLLRGTRIDVQAHVTGIDAHRTDVVSVSQTVRMRPDLSVQAHAGSGTVPAGTPVVVTGSILEKNGDLGAEADCVLLLDGVRVDQAKRIWVDAGDEVTCFFTTPALAEGTHTLTVVAEGVRPGDWNAADNTASVQVRAVAPGTPVRHHTYARNEEISEREFWLNGWYSWDYETPRKVLDHDETFRTGVRHEASFTGSLGRGISAPVTFEIEESADGRVLQTEAFGEAVAGSMVCGMWWNPGFATSFSFCSADGATSTFQYRRHSGTVAYHGYGFRREWDEATGEEYVYHWGGDSVIGNWPAELFRSEYAVTLRIASGDDVITLSGSTPLEPFEEHYPEEEWCSGPRDADGWLEGFCFGGYAHWVGFTGSRSYSSTE